MTRRAVAHAQRTRRLLNQEAMKRAHRHGELIRRITEEAAVSSQRMPDVFVGPGQRHGFQAVSSQLPPDPEQRADDREVAKPLA